MKSRAGKQNRVWRIRPADKRADELARALKISRITAQVLINRSITDPEPGRCFLMPKLTDLAHPDEIPQMDTAVKMITDAIANKKKITIYGDYDVDGITSIAILERLLDSLGAVVDYYIPHRVDEGYGLNDDAIRQIAAGGTSLVITVDCGITAVESAELVRELGMELIITDHHQKAGQLPQAGAILHPQLEDDTTINACAGAMMAFKLAWAVAERYKTPDGIKPALRQQLINSTIFAAMGTIADVIDLTGENRSIANFGLSRLQSSELPGLKALIEACGFEGKKLDSYHIGFGLAPILNAAGRMGHARLAVELLTCDNYAKAYRIAQYLKDQNNKRRQCEKKILKQACEMVSELGMDHPDRRTIVLADENWHTGVIGIVAARLVDRYNRPAILINTSNGVGSGSARSVEGFNILQAISSCEECLRHFGGHAAAAGITIDTDKVGEFSQRIEEYARENMTDEHTVSAMDIDAECQIKELSAGVVKQLQKLGPFGQGNPKPIFATRGVRLAGRPRRVGSGGEHLQLALADSTANVRCVAFSMGYLEKKLMDQGSFAIAYEPQISTFNNSGNVEFVISDVQFE
jgi:single-stranded-DNA-specific exonuclease